MMLRLMKNILKSQKMRFILLLMLPSKTPPRRRSEITHPLESIFLKIQSQQREGGTKLYYCVVRLTYLFKEGAVFVMR